MRSDTTSGESDSPAESYFKQALTSVAAAIRQGTNNLIGIRWQGIAFSVVIYASLNIPRWIFSKTFETNRPLFCIDLVIPIIFACFGLRRITFALLPFFCLLDILTTTLPEFQVKGFPVNLKTITETLILWNLRMITFFLISFLAIGYWGGTW
jgi:hypothetical protein